MEKVYLVKYTDTNSGKQSLETVLSKREHFKAWLKEHNDNRDAEPETEDEFDIEEESVFIP